MKLYDVIRKDEKEKGGNGQPEVVEVSRSEYAGGRSLSSIRGGRRRSNPWKKRALIAVAILLLIAVYVLGNTFAHATVIVHEKQLPFSLQNEQIDLQNSTVAAPGRLSFQTMVVTDSVSRQVFASAMTTSTTKAAGTAVILNQYSKSTETVRSGTTVTSANGEKYITQSAIKVPGYTGSGTSKTPGSAKVNIVASGVGPAYNSNGTTFTVSGWSGANAKLFYGSSVGAITGGQNGAMQTLSDADKAQALATLQAALTEKLTRETKAQIPATMITFPDLQFLSLDANSLNITGTTVQFAATLTGTMVSYLIPLDLFDQTIAAKADSDHVYSQVSIPALGAIQVQPVSAVPANPKNIPDDITVSVTGQGVVVPQVAAATIQQAVAGISGSSFNAAIAAIPEVQTATYSIFPFWMSDFPIKQSRINVIVQ